MKFLRRPLAAFILLCTMLFTMACAAVKDETVVATVNGSEIYKWQYQLYLNSQLEQQKRYIGEDLTAIGNEDKLERFKEKCISDYVEQRACELKAKELGYYDNLTADDEKKIDQMYADFYNTNVQAYMKDIGTDENARKKAEQKYEEEMKNKFLTPEYIREDLKNQYVLEKVFNDYAENMDITQEQLQTWYDAELAAEKEKYDAAPVSFGDNTPFYFVYVPEGYVRVKHIFIKFDEGETQRITELETQYKSVMTQLAQQSMQGAEVDTDTIEAQIAKYENAINTVRERAFKGIYDKASAALTKAQAGDDFEALVKEYNEDSAMSSHGYFVSKDSENYDSTYVEAVMALKKPGDLTGLIEGSGGYYIARLEEIMTPGALPLSEVEEFGRKAIDSANILREATRIRSEWVAECDVEIFKDKL